jgi:hypothetical protein
MWNTTRISDSLMRDLPGFWLVMAGIGAGASACIPTLGDTVILTIVPDPVCPPTTDIRLRKCAPASDAQVRTQLGISTNSLFSGFAPFMLLGRKVDLKHVPSAFRGQQEPWRTFSTKDWNQAVNVAVQFQLS